MSAKHPNILFILSDDQGAWAMGCAGNDEIETPNLDRLAATGMRFENFFCASPVCSPARATLLTGRIPSQHGIHDWLAAGNTTATYEPDRDGELTEYLAGQPGYTDYLAAANVASAASGTWAIHTTPRKHSTFGKSIQKAALPTTMRLWSMTAKPTRIPGTSRMSSRTTRSVGWMGVRRTSAPSI